MSNFHSLEVVDRGSETQLQVGENCNDLFQRFKGWNNNLMKADQKVDNINPVYKLSWSLSIGGQRRMSNDSLYDNYHIL